MDIKVPTLAWYDPRELALSLPADWQVEVCNMAGYNRPALTPAQIKAAINKPIGTAPLRELAKGKKEVVIIFDDMTRVTRIAPILPAILEELAEAGIPDKSIRFIMALGMHGARDRRDFAKKLGEDVMMRFPVFNHNPFRNCIFAGKTKTYGTDVYVNGEVMKCDLRIAIGSVVPHPMNGFGAGGKIVLPGIVSFETIEYNHRVFNNVTKAHSTTGMGVWDGTVLHQDMEEAAELAKIDFLVNSIVNSRGDNVALFAGAMKPAYAVAVEEAKKHYQTATPTGKDIVIANTYAKANEAFIGPHVAGPVLKGEGGDLVLIANMPEGQVTHYLLGPFGRNNYGPLYNAGRLPKNVKRLIVFTEYPDLASLEYYGSKNNIKFIYKWDEVIKTLERSYGENAKVAVFPNAEIQYFGPSH